MLLQLHIGTPALDVVADFTVVQQSCKDEMSKAGEMQLADGILMNLPEHFDQQLEVAQQITPLAVSGRVANLEAELDSLTQKLVEKATVVEDLQARVTAAESMLGGTTAKLAVALQEQAKLAEDKDALADQMKTLMSQVSVLDDFKKAVIKSLGPNSDCDDDPGDATYAYSPEASASTPCSSRKSQLQLPLIMSKGTEPPTPTKRKQQGQYSCMMLISQDSPRDSAKGDESGKAMEDAKSRRIDGKEVFRRARARLTYEQFSDFLNNIREVNALRRAEESLFIQYLSIKTVLPKARVDIENCVESISVY